MTVEFICSKNEYYLQLAISDFKPSHPSHESQISQTSQSSSSKPQTS